MPKNLKISKTEMIRANAVKNMLIGASEALAKIYVASLGLSVNEARTITDAARILGKIHDEAQTVIDQGNKQFQGRDVELINRASNRYFRIDSDLEGAKIFLVNVRKAFDEKTTELKKQGFSQDEINAILDDPTPEIEARQQTIDTLIAEKAKIEQFLGDAPRFDPDLLNGTTIEVEHSENAQAA